MTISSEADLEIRGVTMVLLSVFRRYSRQFRKIPGALNSDLANSIVRVGSLLGVIATATGIWYGYDAFVRARIAGEEDAKNHAWGVVASATRMEDVGNLGLITALEWLAARNVDLGRVRLPKAYLFGIKLPNVRMDAAVLTEANLEKANLSHARMQGAVLSGANLAFGQLGGANLAGVNLNGSNLRRANLHAAILRGADLSGADLSGADLSEVDLRGARIRGSNLFRANLTNAALDLADMSNTCWDSGTQFPEGRPGRELVFNKEWCGPPSRPISLDLLPVTTAAENACR